SVSVLSTTVISPPMTPTHSPYTTLFSLPYLPAQVLFLLMVEQSRSFIEKRIKQCIMQKMMGKINFIIITTKRRLAYQINMPTFYYACTLFTNILFTALNNPFMDDSD